MQGSVKVPEFMPHRVALFLLKTGTFGAKTGRRFPYMLYLALLRFFSKREGQIYSNFDKQMC